MKETIKVATARLRAAVEYVRMRPVSEDALGTVWEIDAADPFLDDRTPGEVRFNVARQRARRR